MPTPIELWVLPELFGLILLKHVIKVVRTKITKSGMYVVSEVYTFPVANKKSRSGRYDI